MTWQPYPLERFALVVAPFASATGKAGYVAAGRSLREVEIRIGQAGFLALAGWLAALIGSLLLCVAFRERKELEAKTTVK